MKRGSDHRVRAERVPPPGERGASIATPPLVTLPPRSRRPATRSAITTPTRPIPVQPPLLANPRGTEAAFGHPADRQVAAFLESQRVALENLTELTSKSLERSRVLVEGTAHNTEYGSLDEESLQRLWDQIVALDVLLSGLTEAVSKFARASWATLLVVKPALLRANEGQFGPLSGDIELGSEPVARMRWIT